MPYLLSVVDVFKSSRLLTFMCLCIVAIYIQNYLNNPNEIYANEQSTLSPWHVTNCFSPKVSSVSCIQCAGRHLKCCQFENLYYFPQNKTFVFVLHETSKIYGINNREEFNLINVGSIENHTELFLPLNFMSIANKKLICIREKTEPVFLLHRFKPDNIMHVLHDDLLPLYVRLQVQRSTNNYFDDVDLIFIDPLANDDRTNTLDDLYKIFSRGEIQRPKEPILYSRALVGLPSDTVGYQYGFNKPQGPIPLPVNSRHIFQRFSAFVRAEINIIPGINTVKSVLYIQRSESRRILNEEEAMKFVAEAYKAMNIKIALSTVNLKNTKDISGIISIIAQADMIFGMHGAATYAAAVFCKPGAVIVEIFPYGIQARVVSPIQSLAQLSNSWFTYGTWETHDPEDTSVPDINSHPLQGGIGHLKPEEQSRVRNTIPVPAVQCCHNATYLYRMFQDTKIKPEFQKFIYNIISENRISSFDDNLFEKYFIPGPVLNLQCKIFKDSSIYSSKTNIDWKSPFNLEATQLSTLTFDITLLNTAGFVDNFQQTGYSLEYLEAMTGVWVKACLNEKCGKDSYAECSFVSPGVDGITIH